MAKIKLGIVDDKALNRENLQARLSFGGELEIVLVATNGQHFLEKTKEMKPEARPEVVLMDIEMPVMDGIQCVALASELYPSIRFLMLTIFDDDAKIFEAIQCGAVGYLLKDEKIENIKTAIRQAHESGGGYMSPEIALKAMNMLAKSSSPSVVQHRPGQEFDLSEREMSVLSLLSEGLEYGEVAQQLFISPNTVRNHIAKIYEKMHVNNKMAAVKVGIKKGWF